LSGSKKIPVDDVNITDPKDEIPNHGPFLKAGEKVTLERLLEMMLTESDNTAAN